MSVRSWSRLLSPPPRRREPPLPPVRRRDAGLVEPLAIPELARDGPVPLIERLAVVGVDAAAHLAAAAEAQLQEPVGIGQRLPGGADEVGVAGREDRLGLRERADPARDDDRRAEAGLAHGPPDPRLLRHLPPERAGRVRERRRHALVPARAGVGIRGLADLGL